jgi:hypothetical protein
MMFMNFRPLTEAEPSLPPVVRLREDSLFGMHQSRSRPGPSSASECSRRVQRTTAKEGRSPRSLRAKEQESNQAQGFQRLLMAP